MNEAFFFFFIAASGVGLSLCSSKARELWLSIAVAIPFGVIVWTILAIASISLNIKSNHFFLISILISVGIAFFGLKQLKESGTRALVIAWLVFVTIIAEWLFRQGWVIISYDSVEQIAVGRTLIGQGLTAEFGSLLASWGALLPLVQGVSVALNIDFLRSLQPLFALSLMMILAIAVYRVSNGYKLVAAFVAIAVLGSSYFMIFQSQYIHNSLPSAVYLLSTVIFYELARRDNKAYLLTPCFISLLGFSLCRTEAPLFSSLILVLGASLLSEGTLRKRYGQLTYFFCVLLLGWNIFLLLVIGKGSDIMTPERLGIVNGVLFAGGLISLAWCYGFFIKLRRFAPFLLIGFCVLIIVIASLWRPEHMLSNILAISTNLFVEGGWGATWIILLLVLPLVLRSSRDTWVAIGFVFGFLTLILLLGMARVPYRIGWGDSANRILTHLLPVLILFIVPMATFGSKIRNPFQALRLLPIGSLIGAVGIGMLLSVYLASIWPKDLARYAKVISSSGNFCPPDADGRYDFEVALGPNSPESYAAVCSNGPFKVVLRFDKPIQADWVVLQAYSQEQLWTSFGLAVSEDGKTWESVYDTMDTTLFSSHENRGLQTKITLPEKKFRFLEVYFRESAGQNRLLLKRLAIY